MVYPGTSVKVGILGKSGMLILRRDVVLALRCTEKVLMLDFQEKPLSYSLRGTVPQTDTGRQVENTKAHERTRVKELGKMVP